MSHYSRGITVVGLGYIGLPTAAAIATQGVRVFGVDINPDTVAAVNRGEVPFVEPDLAVAVSGAVSQGQLTASTEIGESDVFIIAVPTPFLPDKRPDLSYIRAAAEALAPSLRGGEVVVLESTSPPGTTMRLSQWLAELRPDLAFPHEGAAAVDVRVAHCPERVLPGRVMIELVTNDRVVGGVSPECSEAAAEIYRLFCKGEIILTDAGSAEMSKLAENAFRDVNLAFANELASVCDRLDLDVWEIIRSANRHPRVNILNPGPGVGGHCIAVDPWFIVGAAPEDAALIRTARQVNDSRPGRVVQRVVERARRLHSPVIACLGLSFKANIDDLRESPALEVVEGLREALPDARLCLSEPHVDELPERLRGVEGVELMKAEDAIDQADIVVMLVDHAAFRSVNRKRLEGRVVFDTRGFWA